LGVTWRPAVINNEDIISSLARTEISKSLSPVNSELESIATKRPAFSRPAYPPQSMMQGIRSFPFQIYVTYSDNTSSATPTVYVRQGAFVLNDEDGTHRFVATNTLDDEADYTIFTPPNVFDADVTLWAKLQISSLEATIVDEKPDDDPDVFYVCIGKVDTSGGIEQYVHGHIPYGGGSFDVRPTEELFRAVTYRAYLSADDSIVAPETAYNSETMYLYPTADWIRWPAPEGS